MHRLLLFALVIPFAVLAQAPATPAAAPAAAPAPAAKPPAVPALPGTCTITGDGLITDMRDPTCFPRFDQTKCAYATNIPMAVVNGASQADVDTTKKHGQNIMKYAASQVCEGRANCGFYVLQFASAAACDGKIVQDMPGGEYRGLTAAAVINIQKRANREGEAASATGKARGDKTKNPKDKNKLWGAED